MPKVSCHGGSLVPTARAERTRDRDMPWREPSAVRKLFSFSRDLAVRTGILEPQCTVLTHRLRRSRGCHINIVARVDQVSMGSKGWPPPSTAPISSGPSIGGLRWVALVPMGYKGWPPHRRAARGGPWKRRRACRMRPGEFHGDIGVLVC